MRQTASAIAGSMSVPEGGELVACSRTVVLLGAGASRDADLPLTFELAEAVVKAANAKTQNEHQSGRARPTWVSALNFVYGSMTGHQSESGGNPLESVNIERLISALRLLQQVESHEAAPFVLTWKAGVAGFGQESFEASSFGTDGENLAKSLADNLVSRRAFSGRDVESAVAKIALRVKTNSNVDREVFRQAENEVLLELSQILSRVKDVSYLAPLTRLAKEQSGGLDIITLNYDLTIEKLVANSPNIGIQVGVTDWQPGFALPFPCKDETINLIKVHGSLDWVLQSGPGPMRPLSIKLKTEVDASPRWPQRPWIVVGDREKLATPGPTLYLLRAAENALARAGNLVVVGYGFADAHVNSLINDWLGGDTTRTVTVVDPGFKADGSINDVRSGLLSMYGATRFEGAITGSRVAVIREGARTGLQKSLGKGYSARVEESQYFSYRALPGELGCRVVEVSCDGPDLDSVTVEMWRTVTTNSYSRSPISVAESPTDFHQPDGGKGRNRWMKLDLGPMAQGEVRTVYFQKEEEHSSATIEIRASRSDCSDLLYFTRDVSEIGN